MPTRRKKEPVGVALPARPIIYEISTWVWLHDLSVKYGRPIDLATVPEAEWEAIASLGGPGHGPDAVWLMGVWERSPAGIQMALENGGLMADFNRALPDLRIADITGSPYCVRRYVADPHFGGREGLAAARAELARRGIGLILDYVPNHVAPDHAWAEEHPAYFILGTDDDLARAPAEFFRAGDQVIANGRDPYFAPWPDVAQLNAFDPGLRAAVVETLVDIASQCDGMRVDMAMLLATEVFGRTWGKRAGQPPETEFWQDVLPPVRAAYPHVRFIAEVYWSMEPVMLGLGFDYCYDKVLYDRLEHHSPAAVRAHLQAETAYQDRLVRFIENHDEPRAASAFPPQKLRAAAVAAYTLPGAKLFYEGQLDGRTVKLPVFLARRPDEAAEAGLGAFYARLIAAVRSPAFRDGQWRLCAATGWPDNHSHNNLVAWCWAVGAERRIVVVNLSDQQSQARLQLAWPELAGDEWALEDELSGAIYPWKGDEILNAGLFVDLPPWGYHLLAVR